MGWVRCASGEVGPRDYRRIHKKFSRTLPRSPHLIERPIAHFAAVVQYTTCYLYFGKDATNHCVTVFWSTLYDVAFRDNTVRDGM